YNQYNGGVYHPEAIRRYLWHAYDTWPRRPAYVLLMGEGNFNFKNYPCVNCSVSDIQGEPILIPPYLVFADPWQGEVPADNLFVAISGSDLLPDMMIGRLPALNAAEAEAMVDKLLAQTGPQFEPAGWRAHFLCVADNPDDGGNFQADCDAGLALVPGRYAKSKVYHQQAPYTSTAATRAAIIQAIDAGATDLVYHGHGSINRWAHEPLLDVAGTSSLANVGRLPVIQTYGCLDGMFFYPKFPSMAETLLRMPGRGSIGQWSSAGLGYASQHTYLQEGFFRSLFEGSAPFLEGASTFGQAALAGKLKLWAARGTSANHLYQTYTLFGDPALVLAPYLELAQQATPGGWRPGQMLTYTLVFTNAHFQSSVSGVLTDILPDGLISPHVTWSGVVLTPAGEGVWRVGGLAYNSPALVTMSAQLEPRWVWPRTALTNTSHLLVQPPGELPAVANASLARELLLPDLQITQALEPLDTWQPGDAVTFSLSFSNAGASTAWSTVVTDMPGLNVTLHVAHASRPITPLNAHAWQVGDLPPGDGGTLLLAARLPKLDPDSAYVVTNAASIGSPIFDPLPANNTAFIARPVQPIYRVYLPVILRG
ncbi:MAG: DUF11 domain-containing protein, partial [Thermoflexales bacterium]|nr:DUF11 domain-containing protein [Thermoflexales bacterium]